MSETDKEVYWKKDLERDLLAVLRKYRDDYVAPAGWDDPVVAAYDIGKAAQSIIYQWVGYCQLAAGEPDEAAYGEQISRGPDGEFRAIRYPLK
jgi:hypothetical protein